MSARPPSGVLFALVLLVSFGCPSVVSAGQDGYQPGPSPQRQRRPASSAGVDVFGSVGANWPIERESFEAAGLDSKAVEFGGGAQVTNLWRNLFVRVDVSRWSSKGERTFVDDSGNRFPLGIPLDVKATYVDVSTGWESAVRYRNARPRVVPYVGVGAGVVLYSERSPFAEPGEDVDARFTSYHVVGGAEVRLLNWLAVAFDGRYRYVPGLLGKDGVSGALGEDSFGGPQISAGVRIGLRRTPLWIPPRAPSEPVPPPPGPGRGLPSQRLDEAVMIEAAPAFLLPDTTRTPLRVLERGTRLRVLEERGDWVRVEFNDPQFGPRVGYVQRKYVQISK